MPDPNDKIVVASDATGAVELYPPRPFKMYTVIEHELSALEQATDEETISSSFFWGCGGCFGGGGLGWLASGSLSPVAAAAYAAVMTVLCVATVWFGVKWYRARRERRRLSAVIRNSEGAPTRLRLAPHGEGKMIS